ncbi:MAG: helix-turn-helix domain-containing protein [Sciscionella sp.]
MRSAVTPQRRRLGNEIRRIRKAARMTQQQAADRLGCGQGKINKIESGYTSVKRIDLVLLLDAFGVLPSEAEAIVALAEIDDHAAHRGRWSGHRAAVPNWFRTFTDLEPVAVEILSWHGERIPGPLQSEHYMLKQFTEDRAADITALVRNRRERRRVFEQEVPPYYRFVLGEGALRRMPGGPNRVVALDQVEYLVELATTYPKVFIHLLPFDARLSHVENDFTIMRFADGTRTLAFVEHAAGGMTTEDETEVGLFVNAWDLVRGAALGCHETAERLEKLAEELRP